MDELFSAIDFLKQNGEEVIRRFVRSHPGTSYADIRFEVVFTRSGAAENGNPRDGGEHESAAFGVSVHFTRASRAGGRAAASADIVGHGQGGAEIGRLALRPKKLVGALSDAMEQAYGRARASAREKAAILSRWGAGSLGAFAPMPPPKPIRDEIAAIFRRDPRALDPDELKRLCREASAAVAGLGPEIAFNFVAAMSELRRELFISSEGSVISQDFAFSQGDCYVVAQTGEGHQESYDTIGQQRGMECLVEGWRGELMPNPDLHTFALELAREARELAAAPVLKPPEGEVTVVTDPHFNALLSHEILGHPCEADRALKMEAAYAGRSWLLRSLDSSELGRQIASPMLSACSDPGLEGYGHYRYDHEGTPGVRVMHIDRGVFSGFLHSRATAAALNAEPNGSARASEARYVPLIRMSNTFFMPGETAPDRIISEVEHGYFICGHRIPSIAESRENFRISARRVQEIDHGRLGRVWRAGSVVADSKRFFMNVDAVGDDLRLIAIPNCGKGQPMQVKRMSNGGPTIRSRARLAGG